MIGVAEDDVGARSRARPAGFIALTVAAVPTGMKAGVRISPRCIAIVPVRAAPSVAAIEKAKRVDSHWRTPNRSPERSRGAGLASSTRSGERLRGTMIDPWIYPALTAVAVLTGFVDAIAGGGGLIMMPALLWRACRR